MNLLDPKEIQETLNKNRLLLKKARELSASIFAQITRHETNVEILLQVKHDLFEKDCIVCKELEDDFLFYTYECTYTCSDEDVKKYIFILTNEEYDQHRHLIEQHRQNSHSLPESNSDDLYTTKPE